MPHAAKMLLAHGSLTSPYLQVPSLGGVGTVPVPQHECKPKKGGSG